jgi:hypothetical protein
MSVMKANPSAPICDDHPKRSTEPALVKVEDVRPEGYDGTCLRPLGLCELGGCCDACWYRPNHPRFQVSRSGPAGANHR